MLMGTYVGEITVRAAAWGSGQNWIELETATLGVEFDGTGELAAAINLSEMPLGHGMSLYDIAAAAVRGAALHGIAGITRETRTRNHDGHRERLCFELAIRLCHERHERTLTRPVPGFLDTPVGAGVA